MADRECIECAKINIPHEEVVKKAKEIWQNRKTANEPDADDEKKNYFLALRLLRQQKACADCQQQPWTLDPSQIEGGMVELQNNNTLALFRGFEEGDAWVVGSRTLECNDLVYKWEMRLQGAAAGVQLAGLPLTQNFNPHDRNRWMVAPGKGQYGGGGHWPAGTLSFVQSDVLGLELNMVTGQLAIFKNGRATGHILKVPTQGAHLVPCFCLFKPGSSVHIISNEAYPAAGIDGGKLGQQSQGLGQGGVTVVNSTASTVTSGKQQNKSQQQQSQQRGKITGQ